MASNGTRTQELGWKATSTLAGVGGAMLARTLTNKVWSAFSSSSVEPPLNPADRRIDWATAIQWSVAAGIGAGIGRLVSQRLAAAGWEAATGSTPPTVVA